MSEGASRASAKPDTSVLFRALFMHMAEGVALHEITFDGDHFNTNAAGHPLDGTAYYQIARGNGLGPGASFVSSFLASMFWEYFVEIPENPSLNDLILTPTAGAIIGEALVIHKLAKSRRTVPLDPVTDSATTWIVVAPEDPQKGGVQDVKSGAQGKALDGSEFSTW